LGWGGPERTGLSLGERTLDKSKTKGKKEQREERKVHSKEELGEVGGQMELAKAQCGKKGGVGESTGGRSPKGQQSYAPECAWGVSRLKHG